MLYVILAEIVMLFLFSSLVESFNRFWPKLVVLILNMYTYLYMCGTCIVVYDTT